MNLISIFVTGLLTSNILLDKFLGISPFVNSNNKGRNVLYMGIIVTLVAVISSILTYTVYKYILIPTSTKYLKTIVFVLIITMIVQCLELLSKKLLPKLTKILGSYFLLIMANCVVLGITLLNISSKYNFIETIVYSISAGIGFTIILYIFSTIRERIDNCDIPESFKGTPIALIVAAIMVLIFARFTFM